MGCAVYLTVKTWQQPGLGFRGSIESVIKASRLIGLSPDILETRRAYGSETKKAGRARGQLRRRDC
jgi:hypothetical protein